MPNRKITEYDLLSRLESGFELLAPLVVKRRLSLPNYDQADARIELGWRDKEEVYSFVVEAKSQNTPLVVQNAIAQVKSMATEREQPMIFVPYLSPERLTELERAQVSGVDLCGNGIVLVPGRLAVMRTGVSNRYPQSRPLNNPYRGRSAMVGRILMKRQQWGSLKELRGAVQQAGCDLSMPQASKALQAMQDDLIVFKLGGVINLKEPMILLDKLSEGWRRQMIRRRQSLRLASGCNFTQALSSNPLLKWAVSGESSVQRYATFSQGGPIRIAVSSMPLAITLLGGINEPVPNFADVELIESDEAGYYFDNKMDEKGARWASRLQTWLELQAGDARQQDVARDIKTQILKEVRL